MANAIIAGLIGGALTACFYAILIPIWAYLVNNWEEDE